MSDQDKTSKTENGLPTAEAPKKLLIGKRVLRDFVVRSGVRTGKCNTTAAVSDDSDPPGSTCWCSRSR